MSEWLKTLIKLQAGELERVARQHANIQQI